MSGALFIEHDWRGESGEGKPGPREDQRCINCKRPFVFGLKSDPAATVYSNEGKHEVAISQMCERCFDFLFEDIE